MISHRCRIAVLALLFAHASHLLWGQSGNLPPLITVQGDVGLLLASGDRASLNVVVTDRSGSSLPNQPVLFVAPASGATGLFQNAGSADTSFFRVMTDGGGAAAATLASNGTPGVYLVEALVEGTTASVTFAITNVTGDVTPPALASAASRTAVEQKLLFGTQLDETLRVHGPVLVPAGAVISAALPSSAPVATQPYTTDRQSWVLWVDEQPGYKFGHRVRFVIVDAADTTADLSKARITREQSWPVVLLSADGAPNPLLPASALNERPFQQVAGGTSNQPSQLNSIRPAGILAFTPGACAILVHGVVPGGAPDVVNMQNFLVGSGRVSSANALTQASPNGRNAPATRQELAALIQLSADLGCKKVYLYISSHGTKSGSVVLVNGTTGGSDPVSPNDLQALLAPLKGAEICPIIDACYSGALAPAFQGIGSTGTFVSASDATHTAPADVNGSPFTIALIKCWMDPKASSTGDGMVTLDDAKKWVDKNAGQNVTGAKPLSAPINPKNIVLSIPAVSGKAGEQGTLVITRPSNYPLDMRIAAILMLPDTQTATLGRFGERTIEATFSPGVQTVTIQVNFKRDGEVNAFFDGTDPSNLVKVSGSVLISIGGPYAPVNIPPLISPNSTKTIQLYRFEGYEQTDRPVTIQVFPQDPGIAVPEPDILTFNPNQIYADLRIRAMAPGQTYFTLLDSFFAYQDNFTFYVGSPTLFGITPLPIVSINPLNYMVSGLNLQDVSTVVIKNDNATREVPTINAFINSFEYRARFGPGAYSIAARTRDGQLSNELNGNVQLPPAAGINNVDPSTFPASSLQRTFTVHGTGFVPGDRVLGDFFDVSLTPNGAIEVKYVDSTTLMFASYVPTQGKFILYVVDPYGQSSNKFTLTVTDPVPNITRIDPPNPGVGSQIVTVFGSDFVDGLTLGLAFQDGSGVAISGFQIQHVSQGRFDALIQLNNGGDDRMQVINPGGQASNIFPFTVMGSGQGPLINSINPANLTASTFSQVITINGSNFLNGLSVVLVQPGAAPMTFSGSQVQFLGPNNVQIQTVLNTPGNCSITVINPRGATSSQFAFSVAPAGPSSPLTLGCPANSGQVNAPYSSSLTASGGVLPYAFAIIAGLPQEFIVNNWTGRITGTPGTAGVYMFEAQVVDSSHTAAGTVSRSCTINIAGVGVLVTATTNPPGLMVGVDGTQYKAPQTFSWLPGSMHFLEIVSPQNGPPGERYIFSGWSDGGAVSHQVIGPNSPTTYTSNFMTQDQLRYAASPGAGGMLIANPSSADGYYTQGTAVQLTATANAGYQFTGFSGDLTGSANPQSLILNAPKAVTANFGAGPAAPVITAVNPPNLMSNPSPQPILVNGNNFSPGLAAFLGFPGGGGITLQGGQIQNLTTTSFRLLAPLGQAGTFTISVNSGGNNSNVFSFTVK